MCRQRGQEKWLVVLAGGGVFGGVEGAKLA